MNPLLTVLIHTCSSFLLASNTTFQHLICTYLPPHHPPIKTYVPQGQNIFRLWVYSKSARQKGHKFKELERETRNQRNCVINFNLKIREKFKMLLVRYQMSKRTPNMGGRTSQGKGGIIAGLNNQITGRPLVIVKFILHLFMICALSKIIQTF